MAASSERLLNSQARFSSKDLATKVGIGLQLSHINTLADTAHNVWFGRGDERTKRDTYQGLTTQLIDKLTPEVLATHEFHTALLASTHIRILQQMGEVMLGKTPVSEETGAKARARFAIYIRQLIVHETPLTSLVDGREWRRTASLPYPIRLRSLMRSVEVGFPDSYLDAIAPAVGLPRIERNGTTQYPISDLCLPLTDAVPDAVRETRVPELPTPVVALQQQPRLAGF